MAGGLDLRPRGPLAGGRSITLICRMLQVLIADTMRPTKPTI